MTRRLLAACAMFLLGSVGAWAEDGKRTLEVKVNYTGAGTVDATHKIWVVLWDSPDFMQGGAMPVALLSTDAKDGLITFADVQKVPAYLSAAYDPTGGWDGMSGPPPSGTSLSLYGKEGMPAPIDIEAGKTVRVTLPLDDSYKMP